MGEFFEVIIILLIGVYLLWSISFRDFYIRFIKYRKETGIPFPYDISKEEIFEKIKPGLSYDGLKEVYYDESGNICLACKYGHHVVTVKDKQLFVSRESDHKRNLEESECIKAYIWKIFDSSAPVNPYTLAKKLKGNRRFNIVFNLIMAIAAVAMLVFALNSGGLLDSYKSGGISSSCFKNIDEERTIGEAFNDFFASPSWSKHKEGSLTYVNFSGKCVFGGEEETMIIRFKLNDDKSFKVVSIIIGDEEMPDFFIPFILEVIYEKDDSDEIFDSSDILNDSDEFDQTDNFDSWDFGDEYSEVPAEDYYANESSEFESNYDDYEIYSAVDFLGRPIEDAVNQFGYDYQITYYEGGYCVYYEDQSIPFAFIYEGTEDYILGDETILYVLVKNDGIIGDSFYFFTNNMTYTDILMQCEVSSENYGWYGATCDGEPTRLDSTGEYVTDVYLDNSCIISFYWNTPDYYNTEASHSMVYLQRHY